MNDIENEELMMIEIDPQRCTGCEICVEICPAFCLEMDTAAGKPYQLPPATARCILCGHCIAVCPHGALSMDSMNIADTPEIVTEILPSAESVELLMRSRRSIRKFSKKRIPHELFEQLLDTARYAPTAINAQKVHWRVYEKRSDVHQLAVQINDWMLTVADREENSARAAKIRRLNERWKDGIDWALRAAPHLIISYGNPQGISDGIIALTYLELYAASMGIGTCWAGYLTGAAARYSPLQEVLALPDGEVLYGGLMIGYPQYRYLRIPERKPLQCDWVR